MRQIPAIALDLAKRHEGFHRTVRLGERLMAVPYVCPAGFWTIGYGHLCEKDHPPVSQVAGEGYLLQDMAGALAAVLRYCPRMATESDERLAAIVDFTFNLGGGRLAASTLRRRINAGQWDEVPRELRKWVWGGGRKLPGLIRRREEEAALVAFG